MKKNSERIEFDELLSLVEKAGRDQRRQNDLSALIDSLAAAEAVQGHRHNKAWWFARVAAAVCVVALAGVAVCLFLPSDHDLPNCIAVAEVDTVQFLPNDEAVRQSVAENQGHGNVRLTSHMAALSGVEDDTEQGTETELLEKVAEPEPIMAYVLCEEYENTDTDYVNSFDTVGTSSAEENIAAIATTRIEPISDSAGRKRPRRFFSELVRRSEPSEMSGLTLAFFLIK